MSARLRVPALLILRLAAGVGDVAGAGANAPGPIYAPPVNLKSADDNAAHPKLPPLPEGVAELRFRDIYQMPVGPRGLELTAMTRALDQQRVRVLGFMVREDKPVRSRLLLSPFPFALFTREYGLAEDLPPTVMHVWVTVDEDRFVPFTPGLLLLTGKLELGPREEPDGRVSSVRLLLDPPPEQAGTLATAPRDRDS